MGATGSVQISKKGAESRKNKKSENNDNKGIILKVSARVITRSRRKSRVLKRKASEFHYLPHSPDKKRKSSSNRKKSVSKGTGFLKANYNCNLN